MPAGEVRWDNEPPDDGQKDFGFGPARVAILIDGGSPEHGEPTPTEAKPTGIADAEGWLLDAYRAELDHGYEVAERLEAKTQRAIGFTGAFFALVQAAAVSSLLKSLERNDQHWLVGIALAALVALAVAGLSVLRQERLRRLGQVPLDQLNNLMVDVYEPVADRASEAPRKVSRELARIYAAVVTERRDTNDDRAQLYVRARWLCVLSIILTSAELAWGLIARLS
jgi:hypothetical protein